MSKYRYTLYILYPFLIILLLFSCVKQQSVNDSVIADTVKYEEEIIKKDDYISFNSAIEAKQHMKNSRDWDKYKTGIIVRMTEENLPYAEKLLNNKYKGFLVVDKGTMRVLVYDRFGNKIREYPMACGRNYGTKTKKGDMRTPCGFYSIIGIYDSTDWLYRDDDGVVSPIKGVYGKRFIRLSYPSGAIGIHGTNAPWSIGGRCSHGCIRLNNENAFELAEKYVEKGMPIIVNPGSRDISVNIHEAE